MKPTVTHLMPWKDPKTDDGGEDSFRDLTYPLRVAADVAWTVSAPISEPCDHTDAPEGHDVVCEGRNTYVHATFGRLILVMGNGSARRMEVASTPEAARRMAEQAASVLVHLEHFDQWTGPHLDYPDDDAVSAWREAEELKAQMEKAAADAEKAMRDPKLMREIGLEMLKKARAMGDTSDDTGERTGQYV